MASNMASMKERVYRAMSRREIEDLIAQGRKIFISEGHVIKADAWIAFHPGGELSIQHMIGRDATDEIAALHSPETVEMMRKYRIGRIEARWENMLPPIQGGRYRFQGEGDEDGEDKTSELDQQIGNAGSSSEVSRSPSPVFDDEGGLRKRGTKLAHPASSTASSVSSASDLKPEDATSFLDAATRKEISLDIANYPSLDGTTQEKVVQEYRLLGQRIRAEGLMQCNYTAYAWECSRYLTLFTLFILFLRWKWWVLSGASLGALWHQLVFTAHDAGHMGITHNLQVDSVIGILIADFIGGLSMGWWKKSHNVHHIVTNLVEHDPDIQHIPIFAISHRFLNSLRSTYYGHVMKYDAFAKFCISVQPYSYYPIMLFGRFNLFFRSWQYLFGGQAPPKGPAAWFHKLELVGHAFFWYWYGYLVLYKSIDSNWSRLAFFLVSNIMPSPLHVQITLSHFAMSTADLGLAESFAQKQLRTTMDVDCPQWLDFIHGGLQFQAIHHLFPRIPRHNLRRTQKLVQEFCKKVDLPYALYGFVGGNHEVVGRLAEVTRQAAILAQCQRAVTDEMLHGHHHHHH